MHAGVWPWGVNGKALKATNLEQVAILGQLVELRAISLKFGPFVKNLSKGVLNLLDVLTNPDFSAQLSLDIGCARKTVCMDVGFYEPLEMQAIGRYKINDLICAFVTWDGQLHSQIA
jgi:hypothetical protein